MSDRIIFTDAKGIVNVMMPSPEWKGTMDDLARKHLPEGTTYQIVKDTDIPADRTYREAWLEGAGAIHIDVEKAKTIFLNNVRVERDARLEALDIEVIKAVEAGQDVTALAAEKQRLRDLPATLSTELDKCATVDQFAAVPVQVTLDYTEAKNTPNEAVIAIQAVLDAEAKKIDPFTLVYFENIHTAGIWVNSANPARAARAKALIAWADAVWDFATAEQIKQMAGNPTYKTVAELIAALPKIGV